MSTKILRTASMWWKVLDFLALGILDKIIDEIKHNNLWSNAIDANELVAISSVVEEYFRIENQYDPFWEDECRKIAIKICKSMGTDSAYDIMCKLGEFAWCDDEKIEEKFLSYGVDLPFKDKTKRDIIDEFRTKTKEIKKYLDNKSQMNGNLKDIKCPCCGHVTTFDLTKAPVGIKFDYICENCGANHYIKL